MLKYLQSSRHCGLLHGVTSSSSGSNKSSFHISSSLYKRPKNLKGKSKSSQEWLTRQFNDPYVKRAQELNYRARSAFKLIEIDDKVKILKPGITVVECGAAPGAWTQVIVQRINSDGRVSKKRTGMVVGIDLLPIAPLDGAILLGGCDFTSPETIQKVREILKQRLISVRNAKIEQNADSSMNTGMRENKMTLASEENASSVQATSSSRLDDFISRDKTDEDILVDVILSDMAPNATGQRDTDHPRIVALVEKALQFAAENGKMGGHFLAKVWDGSETKKLEECISRLYDKVSRHKPPSSRGDSSELFVLGKYKK